MVYVCRYDDERLKSIVAGWKKDKQVFKRHEEEGSESCVFIRWNCGASLDK